MFVNLSYQIKSSKKSNPTRKMLKKSSNFEQFLFFVRKNARHISILVIAAIVLSGNLLVKNATIISPTFGEETQVLDSIPATADLEQMISTFGRFTPQIEENPQVISKKISQEIVLATSSGSYLVKSNVLGIKTANAASSTSRRSWYIIHLVRRGESLGKLANRYGISASSILAANNISDADVIRPGQRLRIPRKNGVMHVVASGESLIGIVRYFKGDLAQSVSINNLKGDADRTIFAGQKLFIVNGKKPAVTHYASNSDNSYGSSGYSNFRPYYGGGGNHFPYGYCTWYVASKRSVPWHGNANQWLWNSRAMGYGTGRSPRVGAIMVTNESWYGHVAYVESVNGNTVTISEMNYAGWGKVNYRTVSAWYGQYIY